jgi:hypothetical protein
MLNAHSVVFDPIFTSIVAAAYPLHTMLNADSVAFALIVTSIMAAEEHLHNPLQEHIHIINHQYTACFQHHFTEISMPKICII